MAAVKAEKVFKQLESYAGECIESPLVEARKVDSGDRITINAGINIMTKAEESGWQVLYQGKGLFLNDADFAEKFTPETLTGQEKLPEGTKVVPVTKGETIFTQPWSDTDIGVQSTAEADGFLVTLPEDGKQKFLSKAFFAACYENDLTEADLEGQGVFRYIPDEDDKPAGYVVLNAPVTFEFAEGEYEAPAGAVLVENDDDIDGYTVYTSLETFLEMYAITREAKTPAAAPSPSTPKA